MKTFFSHHRKLYLWLLADFLFLAAFWLCRENRAWMNVLVQSVSIPLKRRLGALCYQVPFSVMELLCALLAVFAAGYLLWNFLAVVRAKGHRRRRIYSALLGLLCISGTIYAGFCFLWGVHYYADSFQDRSGIVAEAVAPADLRAVAFYFADRLAEAAAQVPRTEDGCFAVPREEILSGSTSTYDYLETQFPFLALDDPGVKPVYFSRVMSLTGFTGVYCPYTGESCVNMDSPAAMLPSTVAHELAHQRGIASEQECNFLSILACTTCDNPAYIYSGWLMGYIHLGNALYRQDQASYWELWAQLPETVQADLVENNAYWAPFRERITQKVSNRVYDGFLKSYGEEQGLQSYGTVVDLLVVYYRETAARAA